MGMRHPVPRPLIRSAEVLGECRYENWNTTTKAECINEVDQPSKWTLSCSVWCISNKNLDTAYSFFYLLSLIMCERAGKVIARTLSFMRQSNLRPSYFFNNHAYFLDFRAQNYPLIFFLNLNHF